MSKWFEKDYIDRISYILSEFETINLNAEEGMVVLLIQFYNDHKQTIEAASIAQKLKVDVDRIDEIINGLSEKGYLKISFTNRTLEFNLDGIFEHSEEAMEFNETLFEMFENEFKRPLTQIELQRLSDWIKTYELKLISYALREASINKKWSFDYIDKILYGSARGLQLRNMKVGINNDNG